MRTWLYSFCFSLSVMTAHAELAWPEEPTVERYQAIWTRSPFTISSATQEEAASGKWVLVGLASSKNDPMVFLQNRETQERRIVTNQSTETDLIIESVDQQSDYLKSSVRLKTPTELITVRFDAALIAAAIASQPPPEFTNPNANKSRVTKIAAPARVVKRITMPTPPPAPPKK